MMVKTFLLTIKLTKNWYAAFIAYVLKRPMNITFRNGTRGCFDWKTTRGILYLMTRNIYPKQLSKDIFEVNIGGFRIRAPIRNMDSLAYVFSDKFYNDGIDYRGRIVLDIGAYIGDTATYFWYKGASKIICYEPIGEFFYWLEQNVKLNGINAELHNFGISDRQGEIGIPYSELDELVGFKGNKVIKIKTLTTNEVLQKHEAIDICKLVCPNLEVSIFSNLSYAELVKVPVWVIGTYDGTLDTELTNKFCRAGFKLKRITQGKGTLGWHSIVFELT